MIFNHHPFNQPHYSKSSSYATGLPILGGVSIHWTELLTRNVNFMLIGSPLCSFSGREDNYEQYSYIHVLNHTFISLGCHAALPRRPYSAELDCPILNDVGCLDVIMYLA